MDDCKPCGWGARLSVQRQRVIIINKLLTHGPLRAFCCSQCSTRVRISKIDNGETKTRTRINFDNRLFDYRLTSLVADAEESLWMYSFLLLLQSLDYDNCENEVYLQEERRKSLKVMNLSSIQFVKLYWHVKNKAGLYSLFCTMNTLG